MDAEEQIRRFAVRFADDYSECDAFLTVMLRPYIKNLDFHHLLISTYYEWESWISCLLIDIENQTETEERNRLLQATQTVYLIFRTIVKHMEFNVGCIISNHTGRREQRRPVVSYHDAVTFCSEVEVQAMLFLQRLSQFYSDVGRPIPSGSTPWEKTVMLGVEEVRDMIETERGDILELLDGMHEALVKKTEFHLESSFLDTRIKILLAHKKSQYSVNAVLEEVHESFETTLEEIVHELQSSDYRWGNLLDIIGGDMTGMRFRTHNYFGEEQRVEGLSSFLHRFIWVLRVGKGFIGTAVGEEYFELLGYSTAVRLFY